MLPGVSEPCGLVSLNFKAGSESESLLGTPRRPSTPRNTGCLGSPATQMGDLGALRRLKFLGYVDLGPPPRSCGLKSHTILLAKHASWGLHISHYMTEQRANGKEWSIGLMY